MTAAAAASGDAPAVVSDDGAAVEGVAEGEDEGAGDRGDRRQAAMVLGERAGHHAEAEAADRRRQHEAMDEDAAAEPGNAEHERDHHAELVDDRVEQQAPRRGEHGEEDGAGDAMDDAKARHADGEPVDHSVPDRCLQQDTLLGRAYSADPSELQY